MFCFFVSFHPPLQNQVWRILSQIVFFFFLHNFLFRHKHSLVVPMQQLSQQLDYVRLIVYLCIPFSTPDSFSSPHTHSLFSVIASLIFTNSSVRYTPLPLPLYYQFCTFFGRTIYIHFTKHLSKFGKEELQFFYFQPNTVVTDLVPLAYQVLLILQCAQMMPRAVSHPKEFNINPLFCCCCWSFFMMLHGYIYRYIPHFLNLFQLSHIGFLLLNSLPKLLLIFQFILFYVLHYFF